MLPFVQSASSLAGVVRSRVALVPAVVMYSDCLSIRPSVRLSNGPLSFGHGNCLKVFAYLLKINRSLHVVIGSTRTWERDVPR